MTNASSAELLDEIRQKHKKIRIWPFVFFLTIGLVMFLGNKRAPGIAVIASFIIGMGFCIASSFYDDLRKTVVLFYELDPTAEDFYQRIHDAFEQMRLCSRRWHVTTLAKITDRKRNAGATQGLRRNTVLLNRSPAPCIKCNLEVPSIPLGSRAMYFFPDRILIFDGSKVGAVSYKDIAINRVAIQFAEEESMGNDVQVIGNTWRFVNKKGGPDRRFNNNREILIVVYEQLEFSSNDGLHEIIQLSKVGAGEALNQAIKICL
jgi:hypothetical protein